MSSEQRPAAEIKADLRLRFRRYRASLTKSQHEELSTIITEEVKLLEELREAHRVHVYWPLLDEAEIDTRPLVRWLELNGKDVVLPRIVSFSSRAGVVPRLSHVRFPGEAELQINRWGIAEPPAGEEVSPASIDLVIAPALGAGRNGHRIGHGFGYYDEFLASTPARKMAPVYDACLIDFVPAEPHDVALDVIVSERTVVRTRSM